MKKIICTLCLVMSVLCVMAQDSKVVNLQLETRMDYQREYLDGDAVKANSGFKGKYLNVILNGTINEHWSYSYRQRLNKAHADQSFFDATDWIHLTYRLNDNNTMKYCMLIKSVQFSRSVVADSLRPYGLQKARLPCPSPIPGVYSNSCPSHW